MLPSHSIGTPQAKRMKRYNMPKHKTRTYGGDHSLSWISPDDIWLTDDQDWREENAYWEDEWPKPELTFIYKDGVLHKAPGKNTHGAIGRSVPEFNTIARGELDEIALLGRVGTACVCSGCGLTVDNCRHGPECDKAYPERKLVVSFWNLDDLKELGIDACLNELEDQGFIERGTLVSTPLGTYKYSGEHRARETTDDDRDRTRLLQQMHLARGNEKKEIMQQLGVGKSKEEPEDRMSTQWKKRYPGHYWGMTSDGVEYGDLPILEGTWGVGWLDPDTVLNFADDDICFVYTNKLYHMEGCVHPSLVSYEPGILDDIGMPAYQYEDAQKRCLMGRLGTISEETMAAIKHANLESDLFQVGRQIVSFWAPNRLKFEEKFDECMDALYNEQLIGDNVVVSTQYGTFMWPDEEFEGEEPSPEQLERTRLLQQMHLARGTEKKEIMKKLGVGKGKEPEGKMSTQWKKNNAGHYWGMTSDSVEIPGEVIIERVDDENEDYINPNVICNIKTHDECCFIFTGKLYFHKGVECHSGLVRKQPAILTDIGFVKNTSDLTERKALHDRSLLGRIATVPDSLPESVFHNLEEKLGDYVGIQIVSFWTTNRQLYDNLDECMAALDSHGLLAETSLISTPFGNRMWPDGAEIESDELTPEERERIELLQQMHLARGDVKKEIMDKLGLGFEGRPKDKIQTHHNGGDDPTRGAPGKWWSPFGDDINRIANAINENL